MPPAYDWNPAAKEHRQQITALQNQNVQPQNPSAQLQNTQFQNVATQPQKEDASPLQNAQSQNLPMSQTSNTQSQISTEQQYQQPNAALPEDNGSNGETSRFGALWDRTVNGDRSSNNHNNENRW